MKVREANSNDWEKLFIFFTKIYRPNHPLLNKEFWEWQYGNPEFGRSFICLNQQNDIVGHLGANFGGGIAWLLNLYLDEEYRGKGILRQLHNLIRDYFPLASISASKAGQDLFRKMRFIRYYNLVRYVKINPNLSDKSFQNVCKSVTVDINDLIVKDTHYFQQPSIKGLLLKDGSRGVSQENVGGLRIIDIINLEELESQTWDLGYLWMDYITSWNDLDVLKLEENGWVFDYKSVIPWRLNPIEEGYFSDVSFMSEMPLEKDFVVHRSYSDHGRIGSL